MAMPMGHSLSREVGCSAGVWAAGPVANQRDVCPRCSLPGGRPLPQIMPMTAEELSSVPKYVPS